MCSRQEDFPSPYLRKKIARPLVEDLLARPSRNSFLICLSRGLRSSRLPGANIASSAPVCMSLLVSKNLSDVPLRRHSIGLLWGGQSFQGRPINKEEAFCFCYHSDARCCSDGHLGVSSPCLQASAVYVAKLRQNRRLGLAAKVWSECTIRFQGSADSTAVPR